MPEFFKEGRVTAFTSPIAEPEDERGVDWQQANKSWWESHPMTYEWRTPIECERGTAEYFDAIDEAFLAEARSMLGPWSRPFDRFIPYDALGAMDVLEIGVGAGTHAGLLAGAAKSFTGVDLTEQAVGLTRRRLEAKGLTGDVRQMDAEHLEFPDASFDFVWSWGVIHHSARTSAILDEIARVLRPGGEAVLMVYHRSFWWWYVVNGLIRGVLLGDLLRTRSLHQTVQRSMDGALARFYRPQEWREMAPASIPVVRIEIYGAKAEMVPLPASRLKAAVLQRIPDRASRAFLHTLRQGYFLVARHRRT